MRQSLSENPVALTRMQLECLRQAASTDKEIARRLTIAPETVSSHIRAAMRRLGASNRREAMGLLTVHPLYGSIEIPNVQIVAPSERALQTTSIEPAAPIARPTIFGWRLPSLPRLIGRLYWILGVYVGLGLLAIIGLSVLVVTAQLIDRLASDGGL
ncbi:MAG: helix-turn-helix transcriptional regulator [Candidatus Brevundimonas phytovorans]|nr:helix-turn-helix transcriptional regulator [Brevundimonas sp.]WEK56656.1 MAG: helix-turn-helix transcriptional regulator [Brevundimonas sp.]